MSTKNKKPNTKKKEEVNWEEFRKPWIKKKTGLIVIAVVSLALGVLTAAQIVMGGGGWGRAILWGFIFAAMVWLVFFGMAWFQGLLHGKPDDTTSNKK
ncbi:MAG: hypothetical protein PHW11_08990 [Anaerolineaceae bacterium]|jgi:hypothetical protein|nr:hypothetical protein [Anaerolineaceae bacterium]MDD4042819.1 hypothetical protein [Anaerolineaceae bacterium]MDD4577949.1 hypothetical protein [Anaerolineaceae bacterium]